MRSLKVALFAGATFAAALTSAQAADLGPIMRRARSRPCRSRKWPAAGICAATSASARRTSRRSTSPDQRRIRVAGELAHRPEGIRRPDFFGGGVGFQWNSWLRFDATAEYRIKAKFKTIGSYTEFCPGGRCFDVYDGQHSSIVLMANGYIDLGTWMCLTPFVGAGAGYARHTFTGSRDVGFISDGTTGFGYSQATSPSGSSPGRSMPASPTTSTTTSRWSWPTAT